jgi:predicted RNase H-like nuclease
MRVTGVDACRGGWVAVTLEPPPGAVPGEAVPPVTVRAGGTLAALLGSSPGITGIDMPLGLLGSGWREADRAARRLLGPRRSSVFAIPPGPVWAELSYPAANRRCRELTGQGLPVQAWGLRVRLLEANSYRQDCRHPVYEVHPELSFAAMAGAPLADSKHTAAGRALRRGLLAQAGVAVPPGGPAPETDVLDAAAAAWSAWRIAAGLAVVLPERPQRDLAGRAVTIRY